MSKERDREIDIKIATAICCISIGWYAALLKSAYEDQRCRDSLPHVKSGCMRTYERDAKARANGNLANPTAEQKRVEAAATAIALEQ